MHKICCLSYAVKMGGRRGATESDRWVDDVARLVVEARNSQICMNVGLELHIFELLTRSDG